MPTHTIACPTWCALPTGHPHLALTDDDTPTRTHVRSLGRVAGLEVTIEQGEQVTGDGPQPTEAPHAVVGGADLDPHQLLRLADLCRSAANQLHDDSARRR